MKNIYSPLAIITFLQIAISTAVFAQEPAKVKHAEPLYLDLMRDLGARKGEAEFNVGYGMTDLKRGKDRNAFIEYEFAPINRLGLEIEIPVNFSRNAVAHSTENVEGIKFGGQYTLLVNEKRQLSMAVGYMHEFEWAQVNHNNAYKGMVYAPFFVAAKNFNAFSTLLYVSPYISQDRLAQRTETTWSINGNIHYMVPNTGHFIGLENNIELYQGKVNYVLRPQVKVAVSHQLAIGLVTGVPIYSETFKMDFMTRVIWEPNFKKKHS